MTAPPPAPTPTCYSRGPITPTGQPLCKLPVDTCGQHAGDHVAGDGWGMLSWGNPW